MSLHRRIAIFFISKRHQFPWNLSCSFQVFMMFSKYFTWKKSLFCVAGICDIFLFGQDPIGKVLGINSMHNSQLRWVLTILFFSGIWRDKKRASKFMYIPNDVINNCAFCRLQYVVNVWTLNLINQQNIIQLKSTKLLS